jgi:hypothetical protein
VQLALRITFLVELQQHGHSSLLVLLQLANPQRVSVMRQEN